MIVFLHVPKTAGSTFQFILENTFGVHACHTNHNKQARMSQDDLNFALKIFPWIRSFGGHNLIDPLRLSIPNAFHMTFLRDPVERVISQYQELAVTGQTDLTFEESLLTVDSYENLHVKLMAGNRDLDKAKHYLEQCDFVGLTEKFELSLEVLKRLYPRRLNLNYVRKRAARSNGIRRQIQQDRRLMDLARKRNRLDIELYSFAVNEIFPRLCARVGMTADTEVASHEKYSHEVRPGRLLCKLFNHLVYREACKFHRWRGHVPPEIEAPIAGPPQQETVR